MERNVRFLVEKKEQKVLDENVLKRMCTELIGFIFGEHSMSGK